MAYVGIGWIIWRNQEMLPKELIFELHYLGSVEYSFNINFSRPAAPVLAQYFNFINLGFNGFRNVMQDDLRNARLLSRALEMSGYYNVLSDIHRPLPELSGSAAKAVTSAASAVGAFDEGDAGNYVKGLPVVAFRWTDEFQKKNPHLEQKWMQVRQSNASNVAPPSLTLTHLSRLAPPPTPAHPDPPSHQGLDRPE